MSAPPRRMYLDPTDDDARRLFQRGIEGPLLMLNLLRFREIADYSDFPDLASTEPISGSAAYDRYVRHTLPFLAASGGSVEFYGTGGHTERRLWRIRGCFRSSNGSCLDPGVPECRAQA